MTIPNPHQLLTQPIAPLLIKLAAPSSLAFLVQAMVNLTEIWFIGSLGTSALAAIALSFPLLMLTQTASGGALGGATTAAISRALGAGDKDKAQALIWHALTLAVCGAVLFLVIFTLAGNWFLEFLGGSGEVLDLATNYCQVLFIGGVFIWLFGTLSAVFRGMGNMAFPAKVMMIGASIQTILSALLILGLPGHEGLGLVGASTSAIVASVIMGGLLLRKLKHPSNTIQLTTHAFSLSPDLFREILRIALPASLAPLLTVTIIVSLTAIVSSFGETALAGYGIGSRIEFLLIPLVFGLGTAMTSLVGMSIGAGKPDRAEQVGWIGGGLAALVAGTGGLVLAAVPGLWIPLFSDDPATISAATTYITMVGPCYACFGFGLSVYFASQGAAAMTWPVVATLLRVLVAVGGALLLSIKFELGLDGVFLGAAAGMVIYAIVIGGALKLGAWRR